MYNIKKENRNMQKIKKNINAENVYNKYQLNL